MEERIQKIMAAAGIASRRAAEEIILEGRVRVNGAVVTELGAKADPDKDHVKVDGKLINPKQPKTYLMLNKPAGCVTTMFDPEGRPTVTSLLKGVKTRVYPVGRLDYDTEGLLLLTNDGDFAFRVTHPSHELPKTYQVKVKGVLEDRQIENLEQGVFLKDGKTAPARVKKLRKEESNSWIEITIHEGRKRQVRRMIDHTGHSVIKLKRVRIGSLGIGDLPLGSFRYLTPDEVKAVQEIAQGGDGARPEEQTKVPRRPAAAGHVPAFIEGPKPRTRAVKKDAPRSAGAARISRSAAGIEGHRRPAGPDRQYEKRAMRPEQRGQRPAGWSTGQGEKRIARPTFRAGERPPRSRGPRTDERFGTSTGTGRSSGSRPASREQGDRRPESRVGWQGARRSGKPFSGVVDRPFQDRGPRIEGGARPRTGMSRSLSDRSAPHAAPGRRPSGDRPWKDSQSSSRPAFKSSGPPARDRGPRPEGKAQRPAGRTEWRRDDRSRGPAPSGVERGPWKPRPAPGTGDRPRSRPGAAPRPAGSYPRGPKGTGRRRS
jgi:23S rRNA pseudouridine2605 synthase